MSEWAPCGHVPPRKPIELNPRHPVTEPVRTAGQDMLDQVEATIRANEAARIWKITRQVSEGTNPPTGRE